MAYSTDHLRAAGKITVFTTIVGVFAFAVIFLFNLGNVNDTQVSAQENATTTITVLNTPPAWTASTTEAVESSTSTPTNAGDNVSWTAISTDSNGERYYLIVCTGTSTPTAPTPNSGAAPTCANGQTQWAVSASTTSGASVTISTTTTASSSPFAGESFDWYGWICDGNAGTPRCNANFTQGENATNSSPFFVNHRPTFTLFSDDSPVDPGGTVIFYATSSDPDIVSTADTVQLIVCDSAGFSTSTDTCTGTVLATSSQFAANPTTTYSIAIPQRDQNYGAFAYMIDNHGFESLGVASGTDAILTVSNVAPFASSTLTSLVQASGTDLFLTVESNETTGFTLDFVAVDNNSCLDFASSSEIVGYNLSVYRTPTGNSSTTCTNSAGDYDPNNCYPSDLATTTWNLVCTASSTTCQNSTDRTELWECTFPLWYVADPTDGVATTTQYPTDSWFAQVQPIDDDGATTTFTESSVGVNVISFLAFALDSLFISYTDLEPGTDSTTLDATSTLLATGNVGLDTNVSGTAMCTTYSGATPCPTLATSTIPAFEQEFATSAIAYGTGTNLSSTSAQEIEVNVPKTRSTSTASTSDAFWGIAVPAAITFSGSYAGENTFIAVVGESTDW